VAWQILPLYRQPERIESVAELIYQEFWREVEGGYSVADLVAHLRKATDPGRIPLSLIAVDDDGWLLGTINLIENDDAKRMHLRPWLAALVVAEGGRGRGIGSALVLALLAEARRLGLPRLYFGTDGPGFYTRLGARLYEQVNAEFCIMSFELELAR
jgi:predicted N-acetyltransferase YhbS